MVYYFSGIGEIGRAERGCSYARQFFSNPVSAIFVPGWLIVNRNLAG